MRMRHLLLMGSLAALAASSVFGGPSVLYQNDFTTRTSVGAIGSPGETMTTEGLYSYDYAFGNLIGAKDDTTGAQDSWIRRNWGAAGVTVAGNAGNSYAQFAATGDYAYALQPIGSEVSEGVVRVSVDILSPTGWNGSSRATLVWVGDGDFYAGLLESAGEMVFYKQTASIAGFRGTTNSEVAFSARDGDGAGNITQVMGGTPVATGNWYRLIADLDLYTSTYSVDIYDLGTGQPTLATATPTTPVESFTNLGFRRNVGDAATDLNGVSTIGITSYGNASIVGYDNIVVSDPRHEYVRHIAGTNPAMYWQFEDAHSEYTADNKAADTAMVAGGKNEGFGVHRSGIAWPATSGDGVRDNAMASVKGSAMAYDGVNSTANVPVDDYSVQMWVKSTTPIKTTGDNSEKLHYFFARSHANPANVSNSDSATQWQLPDNLSFSGYEVSSPRLAYVSWDNGGSANAENDLGDGLDGRPLTTVTPITHDEWYHVVFARNPEGYVSVYLNGELEIYQYDPLLDGSNTYEGEYLVFGERANYGIFSSYGLTGLMDEIAVWGRALTPEEVSALYHSVPEPGCLSLLALTALCVMSFGRGFRRWRNGDRKQRL